MNFHKKTYRKNLEDTINYNNTQSGENTWSKSDTRFDGRSGRQLDSNNTSLDAL